MKRFFGEWPKDKVGNPMVVRFEVPRHEVGNDQTREALSRATIRPLRRRKVEPPVDSGEGL